MFNSALTSNPNNNKPLGISYCGRFYPAVQDKSTGNFIVYINGIRKEFTFIELLNIQQAEQNRLNAWENLDKSFEGQKADSNKWMKFYEASKKKALEFCKSFNQMKEAAAQEAYSQELAYNDAERHYNQIMSTTDNNELSELDVTQRVHAEEYSEQMATADENKDVQDSIRSYARRKEISFESQYLSACHSAFSEALHGGEIAMQQQAAKHLALG